MQKLPGSHATDHQVVRPQENAYLRVSSDSSGPTGHIAHNEPPYPSGGGEIDASSPLRISGDHPQGRLSQGPAAQEIGDHNMDIEEDRKTIQGPQEPPSAQDPPAVITRARARGIVKQTRKP